MSNEKIRAFRKSKCLCVHCGNEPEGGKLSCTSCLIRKRKSRNQRKIARQKENKCLECKNYTDKVYCEDCTKKKYLWRLANPEKCRAYNRKLYEGRKANGLCVRCGLPSNKSRCEVCVLKEIAHTNIKDITRWQEIHNIFIAQKGICPYTNRSLTIGTDASLDHIVPKSQGGTHCNSNLQWVHIFVQISKWNKSEQDFLNMVEEIATHKLKMEKTMEH